MSLWDTFLDNLRRWGIEYYGRYYGTYQGIVHSNIDPDNRGKIWVRVPAVAGDDVLANMALPKMPFAGIDKGFFFPPEEGDLVYVQFENGDPEFPIYEGGWWGAQGGSEDLPEQFQDDDPQNAGPKRRGIKTAGGHYLVFDDTANALQITLFHSSGTKLNIDNDGQVFLEYVGNLMDVRGPQDFKLLVGDTQVHVKDGRQVAIGAEVPAADRAVLDSKVQTELARIRDDIQTLADEFERHVHPLPLYVAPMIPAPGPPIPALPGGPPAPPSEKPTLPPTGASAPGETHSEIVTIDE